jgi:hypothetical protein
VLEPKFHVSVASRVPARPPHLRFQVTFGDVVAGIVIVPAATTWRTVPTPSAFAAIVVFAMSTVSDVVLVTVTALVSLFCLAT